MLEMYTKDGNLKQISEKEDLDLKTDKTARAIEELPTGEDDTSFFLFVNKNITINDITIPQYSRGIYINNAQSRDGLAIIVDSSAFLYLCFRNNLKWYVRKI